MDGFISLFESPEFLVLFLLNIDWITVFMPMPARLPCLPVSGGQDD